jgi:hypothetical protein
MAASIQKMPEAKPAAAQARIQKTAKGEERAPPSATKTVNQKKVAKTPQLGQDHPPGVMGKILKDREFKQFSPGTRPNQNRDDHQGGNENGREPFKDG